MTSTGKSIRAVATLFFSLLSSSVRSSPSSSFFISSYYISTCFQLPPRTREQIEARVQTQETRLLTRRNAKSEREKGEEEKDEIEQRQREIERERGRREGRTPRDRLPTDLRMQAISRRLRNYWNTSCP